MYCKKCGKELPEDAAFCNSCGTAVSGAEAARAGGQPIIVNVSNVNTNQNNAGGYAAGYPYKSRWAAFFLCFFLGTLGIHRFYVGKMGTGIIWLFTLGLGGFGVLIDLIVILIGGFRDKAGYPLR